MSPPPAMPLKNCCLAKRPFLQRIPAAIESASAIIEAAVAVVDLYIVGAGVVSRRIVSHRLVVPALPHIFIPLRAIARVGRVVRSIGKLGSTANTGLLGRLMEVRIIATGLEVALSSAHGT